MNEFVRRRARARARGRAAAAAVTITVTALALPGVATAASAPTDHACSVEGQNFPIAFSLDTDLPASAPAASSLSGNLSTRVDVPANVAKTMADLGVATFGATFTTTVTVGGVDVVTTSPEVTQSVNAAGFPVEAQGSFATTAPATVGPASITGKSVQVALKLRDANGNDPLAGWPVPSPLVLGCSSPSGLVVDTLEVTAASTKIGTRTSLAVAPKKAKAGRKGTVTVSVKALSGAAPKGRVSIQVTGKAGGKKVRMTKVGTLAKGRATVSLGKLKKGKLTIVARYAGTATHARSASKKVVVKVT